MPPHGLAVDVTETEALIPETKAAERLAAAIGSHLQPAWFTTAALVAVCKKVIAHRGFFRGVFDELDATPGRIGERDVVLRQQSTQQLSDPDYWAEHVHHLRRELTDAEAILERVKAGTIADFDPDARDRDREDDRERVARQDEAASAGAPRIAS